MSRLTHQWVVELEFQKVSPGARFLRGLIFISSYFYAYLCLTARKETYIDFEIRTSRVLFSLIKINPRTQNELLRNAKEEKIRDDISQRTRVSQISGSNEIEANYFKKHRTEPQISSV